MQRVTADDDDDATATKAMRTSRAMYGSCNFTLAVMDDDDAIKAAKDAADKSYTCISAITFHEPIY